MDPEQSERWLMLVFPAISNGLFPNCCDSRLYLPLHQRFLLIILTHPAHTAAAQSQVLAVKYSVCTLSKNNELNSASLLAGTAEFQ